MLATVEKLRQDAIKRCKERITAGEKRAYVPTLPGLKSKWI
jgi:hypothetical protein